jgi:hypothetical protein
MVLGGLGCYGRLLPSTPAELELPELQACLDAIAEQGDPAGTFPPECQEMTG